MRGLSDVVAKARGISDPTKPRQRFTLPLPTDRCECGSDCVIRESDQDGWSCVRCLLEAGAKLPDLSVAIRDGWQGGIVGYE